MGCIMNVNREIELLKERVDKLEKILSNERETVRKHEQKRKLCRLPDVKCPSMNIDGTCKLHKCFY